MMRHREPQFDPEEARGESTAADGGWSIDVGQRRRAWILGKGLRRQGTSTAPAATSGSRSDVVQLSRAASRNFHRYRREIRALIAQMDAAPPELLALSVDAWFTSLRARQLRRLTLRNGVSAGSR
jgi:hypothetical protein